MKMHGWLNRLFGNAEEINGGEVCPTYLYRWVLCGLPRGYKVYLHHFVGDDSTLDYHDHPKRFVSIGLWGSYVERIPVSDTTTLESDLKRLNELATVWGFEGAAFTAKNFDVWEETVYRAPWVRTFPAEWKHRIRTPSGSCWTLVIVGRSTRDWGFWHRGQFVAWKTYIRSGLGKRRKACQ